MSYVINGNEIGNYECQCCGNSHEPLEQEWYPRVYGCMTLKQHTWNLMIRDVYGPIVERQLNDNLSFFRGIEGSQ